ncbi:helix-turn-helix domain-containing protein [Lentzea sp. NEAU-D13]|uniref:Helix-turn-helix domain-containing protein n=1 Tax=Lentzea alba TaxID=2714351 RepID=A0A7C9RXH2_9PSEU|nr:helix-turn-helix domain-containing protein [Lentzea alba]NGY65347.1 helix-turn-helix domain-containing protein [Lentzea alba]
MIEFGAELRRRRLKANLSQHSLGARVYVSKGYVSRIENGRVTIQRDLATKFDDVLEAGGELLALLPAASSGSAEPGEVRLRGLPSPPLHFVGRDRELATLASVLLGEGPMRMCVLHGTAGVGKTAIALTAARQAEQDFPDGVLFFDLGGHTPGVTPLPPAQVLHTMLTMLGVAADRIPADVDGRANVLRDRLHGRRVLLVFDNVADTAQVRPLLPAEEACRVLVTSRRKLSALDDAWHVRVEALDTGDAVGLFRALAGDETPDPAEAARIVALCDRLPLAVRIAAVRYAVGGWSAARFRARLVDEGTRLASLNDGERGVATAFAVSYSELPPDQRWMFGLLACHPGTVIEADAADAMAGLPEGESDLLLDRLNEANLVALGEHGYGLHDLVRLFAVSHALPEVDATTRAAAVTRVVAHTVDRVAAADELLNPRRHRPVVSTRPHPLADRRTALDWLRAQWPTLVRLVDLAGDHGLHRDCWQLAHLLRGYFFHDRLIDPWLAVHERGLEAAREDNDLSAVGMMFNGMGMAHIKAGAVDAALECHQRAFDAFTAAGDEHGVVDASSSAAWTRIYRGEQDIALKELTSVLGVYRRTGRRRNTMIALRGIALALTDLGRFDEAISHAQESWEIAAQDGADDSGPDDEGVIMALNCLAWIDFRADRHDAADSRYAEAADVADLAGHADEHARAITGRGNVAASRGEFTTALALWSAADTLSSALNLAVLGEARVRADLEGRTRR